MGEIPYGIGEGGIVIGIGRESSRNRIIIY